MAETKNGEKTFASVTYHMGNNTADLYEVQRTNNFEFVLELGEDDKLYRALRAASDSEDSTDYLDNAAAEEVIKLSCASAPIPHFSQEEIEIKRGNAKYYAAGVPTFDGGDIKVYDFIGANGKSVLMAWQKLSYNVQTEAVGLMKDYKKKCYVLEYTPDWKTLVRTWVLEGCWVTKLSEPDRDWESNDKVMISATIRFDKAYIEDEDDMAKSYLAK